MLTDIFFQNRAGYDVMRRNMIEPGRSQMAIQNCARALHAG